MKLKCLLGYVSDYTTGQLYYRVGITGEYIVCDTCGAEYRGGYLFDKPSNDYYYFFLGDTHSRGVTRLKFAEEE